MKENKIIIITAILNFIVASLKLIAGLTFSFSTLIADSIQSFMDFLTDIISIMANKVGKRRANKTYPFGYGQVYYLANLFTGVLLFFIGAFIICQFFLFGGEVPRRQRQYLEWSRNIFHTYPPLGRFSAPSNIDGIGIFDTGSVFQN